MHACRERGAKALEERLGMGAGKKAAALGTEPDVERAVGASPSINTPPATALPMS